MSFKIEIETSSYNEKRYSKPWIAKVTFLNDKPQYQFGNYVGQPGYSGLLVIEAKEGDIVARGQKDNRRNNTDNDWYIVDAEGKLQKTDRVEAYKHYMSKEKNGTN